jgi:hypothetical protein
MTINNMSTIIAGISDDYNQTLMCLYQGLDAEYKNVCKTQLWLKDAGALMFFQVCCVVILRGVIIHMNIVIK